MSEIATTTSVSGGVSRANMTIIAASGIDPWATCPVSSPFGVRSVTWRASSARSWATEIGSAFNEFSSYGDYPGVLAGARCSTYAPRVAMPK